MSHTRTITACRKLGPCFGGEEVGVVVAAMPDELDDPPEVLMEEKADDTGEV